MKDNESDTPMSLSQYLGNYIRYCNTSDSCTVVCWGDNLGFQFDEAGSVTQASILIVCRIMQLGFINLGKFEIMSLITYGAIYGMAQVCIQGHVKVKSLSES